MLQWPEMCGNNPEPSAALSLSTQALSISTVPVPSGVLQLHWSPGFRNAATWLCDGFFRFFVCSMGLLFGGSFYSFFFVVVVFLLFSFGGFGCVGFFIF